MFGNYGQDSQEGQNRKQTQLTKQKRRSMKWFLMILKHSPIIIWEVSSRNSWKQMQRPTAKHLAKPRDLCRGGEEGSKELEGGRTVLKQVLYLFCVSRSCRLSHKTPDLVLHLAILSFPKCIERRMVKWYTTKRYIKEGMLLCL